MGGDERNVGDCLVTQNVDIGINEHKSKGAHKAWVALFRLHGSFGVQGGQLGVRASKSVSME